MVFLDLIMPSFVRRLHLATLSQASKPTEDCRNLTKFFLDNCVLSHLYGMPQVFSASLIFNLQSFIIMARILITVSGILDVAGLQLGIPSSVLSWPHFNSAAHFFTIAHFRVSSMFSWIYLGVKPFLVHALDDRAMLTFVQATHLLMYGQA